MHESDTSHAIGTAEAYCESKRYINDTVVSKSTHSSQRGALLAAAQARSRDEQTRVLAVVATRHPLATSVVPEGLPLRGEVAVSRGNTKEEGVILGQRGGVVECGDCRRFGSGLAGVIISMHSNAECRQGTRHTCIFVSTS